MDAAERPDPARTLESMAREALAALERKSLRRHLTDTGRTRPNAAERGGRELISFSCNDYLNLSHHPEVCRAAIRAIETYGAGAGASRLVTGNHPLYRALETRLARMKGTEAAIVFGSGYLANTGIIPALVGKDDLIVMDELAHACMHAGARLSHAKVTVFRHNDIDACRDVLAARRARYGHCLLLTERVFSMDGDVAPAAGLAELAREFDAWLMTDDAHGFGVLDAGDPSHAKDVPLQMGTLSKAVGAYGGYLCAAEPVIELIRNRARSFIYTTGLPPSVVASADAALAIMEQDPDLIARPLAKARLFTSLLNLPSAQSSIVPVILGEEERALAASDALREQGFLVIAIRPPTVPEGTARLRFTFTAGHEDVDIRRLADGVRPFIHRA